MQAQQLVQTYLQSLGQRNLNAIMNCFAEQVEWNIPGDREIASWTGKRSTKAEIKEFFTTLWENTVPLSAEVDLLLADEENVVVTGVFASKMVKTGKTITSPFSIRIGFKNGLITKYILMEDSYQLSQCLK